MDSTQWAQAAVSALMAGGVQHFVVCPGSRSAPLAFAVASAARGFHVRAHVRTDERAAGFLALGLAKPSGLPAVVITTSGTAVAELTAAVWEAHHSKVPLIVLSADRPEQLHGSWANQTTPLQRNAFGDAIRFRWAADADDQVAQVCSQAVQNSMAGPHGAGPVHLNVGFTEPLHPDEPWRAPAPQRAPLMPNPMAQDAHADRLTVDLDQPTVVIAGDGAGRVANDFADSAGLPLLAEPSSGAHYGQAAITAYPWVLAASDLAHSVSQVVVFGRPTLSRSVSAMVENSRVVHVAADYHAGPANHANYHRTSNPPYVGVSADSTWTNRWRDYARVAQETVDARYWDAYDLTPYAAAHEVTVRTGRDQCLMVGASMAIRAVAAAPPEPFQPRSIYANRGLAGIDGTLSTGIGIAASTFSTTRILLGDLAFFYDLTALAIPADEWDEQPVQIIVLNDDGGGIFSLLEYGDPERGEQLLADAERMMGTPTGRSVKAACEMYGIPHSVVHNSDILTDLCSDPSPGLSVVEVPYDRASVRTEHHETVAAVREALEESHRRRW